MQVSKFEQVYGENRWVETYGEEICAMSLATGTKVKDTALLIAAVLGNLAGATAGLLHHSGRILPPGYNLLALDSAMLTTKRALDEVIAPALEIQNALRVQAQSQHRPILDQYTFGTPNQIHSDSQWRDHLYERSLNVKEAMIEDLNAGDGMIRGWRELDDETFIDADAQRKHRLLNSRIPGIRYRPSLLHCTNDVMDLEAKLLNSFDHHVLLLDTSGSFFRGSFMKGAKQGNQAMSYFAAALNGMDIQVPPLHSNQGCGMYQHAKAHFIASMSVEDLADAVDDDSSERGFLGQSILWNPQSVPIQACGQAWWQPLIRQTEKIINGRILRKKSILTVSPAHTKELVRVDNEIRDRLAGSPDQLLGAFDSLVYKLLWAFLLLDDSKGSAWPILAAEATAKYALNCHLAILDDCRTQSSDRRLDLVAQKLIIALESKGALTPREMQRSISRGKQPEITGAVERLLKQNRIVQEPDSNRYCLKV